MEGLGLWWCRVQRGTWCSLLLLLIMSAASSGKRLVLGLLVRDRDERRDLKFVMAFITQSRWPILRVKAWLTSSSFGASTSSEQFSSASRSGSVPSLVTHGCSYGTG
jgi:hypothetical protein